MNDKKLVFLFEPDSKAKQQLSESLIGSGHELTAASATDEATALLEETTYSLLLITANQAGYELSQYVREFMPTEAPVIALVSEGGEIAEAAVSKMAADGYLIPPYSRDKMQMLLSLTPRLSEYRKRMNTAEKELADKAPQLRKLASALNSRTGFYQFEFIKDLLVTEVRRSKRYSYPLSILLIGLDSIPALSMISRPNLQREITSGLAVAIAKSIRDIDIPIHFADDRILVFLPHTDQKGAEEVGRRIKRRIRRITYRGDGITAQLTASVGIAGMSAGENLTFSRLIRDASVALKAAQLKGGDKVMKRVTRKSPEI